MKNRSILYFDWNKTIYTNGIKKAIESNGDKVEFITYDEFQGNNFNKRFSKDAWQKERESKIDEMFNYIKSKKYDIILVKAPFSCDHKFFQRLAEYFPKAFKINYNWSSVETYDFLPYRDYFDKVWSFDINDCEKYGLDYYPLFYLPEFEKIGFNFNKTNDISFIGSILNVGRTDFFNSFLKQINEDGLRHKFYFFCPKRIQYLSLVIKKPSMIRYVGSKFMPLNEVLEIVKNSISMIDYPMDIQSGLTIRTFETIAAGLLLITTNSNIQREPFYNPDKIKIIKSDLSDFDPDCIKEYKPEWDEAFEKYSVNNWVRKITEY